MSTRWFDWRITHRIIGRAVTFKITREPRGGFVTSPQILWVDMSVS
jgi:hypothetical protein